MDLMQRSLAPIYQIIMRIYDYNTLAANEVVDKTIKALNWDWLDELRPQLETKGRGIERSV